MPNTKKNKIKKKKTQKKKQNTKKKKKKKKKKKPQRKTRKHVWGTKKTATTEKDWKRGDLGENGRRALTNAHDKRRKKRTRCAAGWQTARSNGNSISSKQTPGKETELTLLGLVKKGAVAAASASIKGDTCRTGGQGSEGADVRETDHHQTRENSCECGLGFCTINVG